MCAHGDADGGFVSADELECRLRFAAPDAIEQLIE
jgi:hypothetical protein